MKNTVNKLLAFDLFLFLIVAIIFAFSMDYSFSDDGLRHISYAKNIEIMKNWGEIFPHSLFSSYDPWLLWHLFLQFLLQFFSYDTIHIAVNSLTLFILMVLVNEYLKKVIKFDLDVFKYILIFTIISLGSFRYTMLRPDLLSGLYVMIALLLPNRFSFMFILTLLYAPFYYLFFLYTGSIGLVTLIQKKYKAFFGVFLASILSLVFFLFYDFNGYVDTVLNILRDQSLRMGLQVGEGLPLFGFFEHINYYILLPLFFGITFYLIYKYYSYFLNNSIALFLLITSILWLNQQRYFALFLPLVMIYAISIFLNTNKKYLLYILRKYYVLSKQYLNVSKRSLFFCVVVLFASVYIYSKQFYDNSSTQVINEAKFFNDPKYTNKILLFNSLNTDIYKALYHNPTIKTVPSCSIGWFDNTNSKLKDIYIRMQKDEGISEEELHELIQYVKADYYIHYNRNQNQILNFKKLESFGIIPKEIYHNRIIFEIQK